MSDESPERKAERRIAKAAATDAPELDLSGLALTSVPEALFRLAQLQTLDLNDNQLNSLPEAMGQLTALQSLLLNGNQLSTLPEAMVRLTQLQHLILSHNKLSTLPEVIVELNSLRSLDLSDNQLRSLPEATERLAQLQRLDISFNQLSTLPEGIGKLAQLKTLNASGNKLNPLPVAIGKLTQLQYLYLDYNQLSTLPEGIGKLTQLQTLSVSRNQLRALPPAVGNLTQLQTLYLDDNKLSALPEDLRGLGQLTRLFLHGNDGLGIPPDVLGPEWLEAQAGKDQSASPADILAFYFRSRLEATKPLHEAKLLIVGQASVGKTSLVKRIVHDRYDPDERMTEGINIEAWSVPLEPSEGEIKVNIWDFGGQEIMHATHQFFLTTRSLYLVVLDARKGENESRLHTWLKVVESYGGGSPIIVVINKWDRGHWLELNERGLRRDYPRIRGFAKVSCETRAGIDELAHVIQQQVRELPHVADPMPVSFFDLKRDLEARTTDYLTLTDYQEACRAHGVEQEREQESYLRILHVLGSMLNYHDPDSPYDMRDTNVLKPEWVTDGVYRILNNNALMQAHGVLDLADLGGILTDHARFPADRHRFIIEMMRKFELCFDFPDVPGRLLIPELLSPNEPNLRWPEAREALNFEYHYNVLPNGLLSRFIVRMHHAISKQTYWRSGVLLDIEGNEALVRADEHAARIYISIIGPEATRRSALSVIRNEFRAIHGTISALKAEEKVPLPEDPQTLLDYEELLALERDRFEYIPRKLSDGTTRRINVKQLLDGISDPEIRDREQHSEERMLQRSYKQRDRTPRLEDAEEAAPFAPAPPSQPEPRPVSAQQHQPTWERIATPIVGLGFIAGLIAIALFVPEPTKFQILVFRVVLALGAGAFGALIPGFIEVSFKNWLRAGGAIALFVIVYLINPPAFIAEGAKPPEAPPAASAK